MTLQLYCGACGWSLPFSLTISFGIAWLSKLVSWSMNGLLICYHMLYALLEQLVILNLQLDCTYRPSCRPCRPSRNMIMLVEAIVPKLCSLYTANLYRYLYSKVCYLRPMLKRQVVCSFYLVISHYFQVSHSLLQYDQNYRSLLSYL